MISSPQAATARTTKAFTLMELMVVAAILAILAGVSGTVFFGQRAEAKKDRARADLQVIQLGLEAYKARFGDYPRIPAAYPAGVGSDAEYLLNALCGQIGPAGDVISGSGIPAMLNTSVLTFAKAGLPLSSVKSNHIVDPWGSAYEYDDQPKNADDVLLFGYGLRSPGQDGSVGTEDDIVAQ